MEKPIKFKKKAQYIDFRIDMNRIDMIFVYCQAMAPYDMRCSNSFKLQRNAMRKRHLPSRVPFLFVKTMRRGFSTDDRQRS